jgi:energy-coupling factor transport system permease protein
LTAGLVFGGLLGVCVGVYGLLDGTASHWLGLPTLAGGAVLAAAGIGLGGRRTGRSRYRPDPWALPEWLVAGCGVLAALAMFVQMRHDPASLVLASVTELPPVPLLAVVGILIGALPVVLAPPPPAPAEAPTSEPARFGVAA